MFTPRSSRSFSNLVMYMNFKLVLVLFVSNISEKLSQNHALRAPVVVYAAGIELDKRKHNDIANPRPRRAVLPSVFKLIVLPFSSSILQLHVLKPNCNMNSPHSTPREAPRLATAGIRGEVLGDINELGTETEDLNRSISHQADRNDEILRTSLANMKRSLEAISQRGDECPREQEHGFVYSLDQEKMVADLCGSEIPDDETHRSNRAFVEKTWKQPDRTEKVPRAHEKSQNAHPALPLWLRRVGDGLTGTSETFSYAIEGIRTDIWQHTAFDTAFDGAVTSIPAPLWSRRQPISDSATPSGVNKYLFRTDGLENQLGAVGSGEGNEPLGDMNANEIFNDLSQSNEASASVYGTVDQRQHENQDEKIVLFDSKGMTKVVATVGSRGMYVTRGRFLDVKDSAHARICSQEVVIPFQVVANAPYVADVDGGRRAPTLTYCGFLYPDGTSLSHAPVLNVTFAKRHVAKNGVFRSPGNSGTEYGERYIHLIINKRLYKELKNRCVDAYRRKTGNLQHVSHRDASLDQDHMIVEVLVKKSHSIKVYYARNSVRHEKLLPYFRDADSNIRGDAQFHLRFSTNVRKEGVLTFQFILFALSVHDH